MEPDEFRIKEKPMKVRKRLGQHFLTDKNMLEKIIRWAEVSDEDRVLEIGPGPGYLTRLLAEKAGMVMAVETDKDMKEPLSAILNRFPNLSVNFADFLRWDLSGFLASQGERWRIIANIPYNITTPILQKVIEEGTGFITDAHLLMQREVAERIVSNPGRREYGRLSVYLQYYSTAEILFNVPPSVFVPPPKVMSSLLRITFNERFRKGDRREDTLIRIIDTAFFHRRKQVQRALREEFPDISREKIAEMLNECGIAPETRGESISLPLFEKLAEIVKKTVKNSKTP